MADRCRLASVIKATDITSLVEVTQPVAGARPSLPRLLERVAELGTMHDAAAALGVEEDLAWNALVAANNLSEVPLLQTLARHPRPTPHAQRLLGRSENLAHAFLGFLDAPEGGAFRQFHLRQRLLRGLEERTSARNQFYCRVRLVARERVNAVVTLDLGGGDHLTAHITTRSIEDLGLVSGCACHALFDPAWVEVRPDTPGSTQQNCLRGTVARCLDDPVDSEVTIALGGGRLILATMTHAEMLEKNIQVGHPVCAVVQASQIILAVYEPLTPIATNRRETWPPASVTTC